MDPLEPTFLLNGATVDFLVIGAGAAGLWSAGEAARRIAESGAPLSVAVLDSRRQVGAKILMSGGTRCNLTHTVVEPADFRGGAPARIARVLRAHPPEESVRRFREELGVGVKEEPGGKLFPEDDSARTVLEALLRDLERRGVPLLAGLRCVGLHPDPGGWRVVCRGHESTAARIASREGPERVLRARRVLLCTGGRSYPNTGSDGSGWALLERLGHSVVPPVPALTPFHLEGTHFHAALSGIALPCDLRLRVDGRIAGRAEGPLLWTHRGASGPAVLDLSGLWARARADLPGSQLEVEACFLPGKDLGAADAEWVRAGARDPGRSVRRHFADLPHRFLDAIAERTGVDPSAALAQTPKDRRRALLAALTAHALPVVDVGGFGKAEVTSGGVPIEETDGGLESRIAPGLHLAGEVLHVDGRLGGFNFQWAWSSGAVAAAAAVTRLIRPAR